MPAADKLVPDGSDWVPIARIGIAGAPQMRGGMVAFLRGLLPGHALHILKRLFSFLIGALLLLLRALLVQWWSA